MVWSEAAPAAIVALLLVLIPGAAINAGILRFSVPASILFAAPVGAGFLGLLAYALDFVGIAWSLGSVLASLAALALASAAFFYLARSSSRLPLTLGIGWSALGWTALGVAIFAMIQGATILPAMGSLDAVPTVGDAHFHLQGARLIHEAGSAIPISPFGFLYGVPEGDLSPYYPTLWHSVVVALLPLGTVVEATNTTAIAVGLLLWPMSLSSFALALRPRSPLSGLVAPLCASIIVLMPGIELFGFAVYPLSLSVVLLAGSLALLALLIRNPTPMLGVAFVLASFGTVSAQPTSGLIIALVLVVWGIWSVLMRVGAMTRSGQMLPGILIAVSTVAGVVAVLVMLPRVPLVRSLNERPTEVITYREAVVNMVLGPVYANRPNLVVSVLLVTAVVGAIISLRSHAARIMVFAAAGIVVLYVAAAGPESYLRVFTSPWWKDASRFAIFLLIFVVGFSSTAMVAVLEWISRIIPGRKRTTGAVLGFVSAGVVVLLWAIYPRGVFSVERLAHFVRDTYDRSDETSIGLNADELELLEELDSVLPEGTVVVGDPDSGVAWIGVLSHAQQFQGMRYPQNDDQAYLGVNFANILEDERVCEIIDSNDIAAFLQSDSPTKEFVGRNEGFNQVDTSVGFELIDSVGGARLYRITACD